MIFIKNYFKRSLGDRYDGWRVRKVDAVFAVVPFIMRSRMDRQNYFAQDIDFEPIQEFIRSHKDEIPGLATIHVIMAAVVRVLAERPYMNRFVVHNKIYAHNSISICMMIKRSLEDDGEETSIKPEFDPHDTLSDVVRRVNEEIEASMPEGSSNAMDKVARWFSYIPACIVRFLIWVVRWLDNFGIMPKFINKASPFHCSAFVTNLASLRSRAIYHHLYEFGTCSAFMALGAPETKVVADGKGTKNKRVLTAKYVVDEGVADGHYYVTSIRRLHYYLKNPELLLTPPEKIALDDGVTSKRLYKEG